MWVICLFNKISHVKLCIIGIISKKKKNRRTIATQTKSIVVEEVIQDQAGPSDENANEVYEESVHESEGEVEDQGDSDYEVDTSESEDSGDLEDDVQDKTNRFVKIIVKDNEN